MSRAEAAVLVTRLLAIIDDLRDLRHADGTPQHVVQASDQHINDLQDAARELRRIHGICA